MTLLQLTLSYILKTIFNPFKLECYLILIVRLIMSDLIKRENLTHYMLVYKEHVKYRTINIQICLNSDRRRALFCEYHIYMTPANKHIINSIVVIESSTNRKFHNVHNNSMIYMETSIQSHMI